MKNRAESNHPNGLKIVGVTFNRDRAYTGNSSSGKVYHYKTYLDLNVGDECVVDSPYGTAIVTVVAINPENWFATRATKWIVDRVDRRNYNSLLAAEQEHERLAQEAAQVMEKQMAREAREALVSRFPGTRVILARMEVLEEMLGLPAKL